MSRDRSKLKRERKEILTIRTTSKRRFIAELAARYQRRSVSSFVEWAIEETAKNVKMTNSYGDTVAEANAAPLACVLPAINVANDTFFAEESDRFIYLASVFPNLLSYEEMQLWKLINECKFLRAKRKTTNDPFNIDRERLSDNWEQLKAVADGRADKSTLPIS